MAKRNIEIKKRGNIRRKIKPVYLIVAEGKNKTETTYLSHFQGQEKSYSLRFAKAGNKTDADSLYETMQSKWKELELSSDNGDKGFIVVDIDKDPHKASGILDLINRNTNDAISFVVSNPTFEIWLLLHFKYTTKQFPDGNAVISELKKYIPDYAKNRDCFVALADRLNEAISNSDKLEKHFAHYIWPSDECNPRTDMGRIVSILIE